jgi:hypothetical protein
MKQKKASTSTGKIVKKLSYIEKYKLNMLKVRQVEQDRQNGIITVVEPNTKDPRKMGSFTHKPFQSLLDAEEDELRRYCYKFGISGGNTRYEMIGLLIPFWPKPLSVKKDLQSISVQNMKQMCQIHGLDTKDLTKMKMCNMLVQLQRDGKITVLASASDDE